MTGDCHVRILWEPGAEMPRATRPSAITLFYMALVVDVLKRPLGFGLIVLALRDTLVLQCIHTCFIPGVQEAEA